MFPDGGDPFFPEIQQVYDEIGESPPPGARYLRPGELADPRKALLPVMAAVGGMVVPATVYALCLWGGPGWSGWGVPMATDIAFAVGVLTLFGSRVTGGAKLFLLALAIVDDRLG